MSDPTPSAQASGLVQELLAKNRELMVANERLKLELEERVPPERPPDLRAEQLEAELRRLRAELRAVRLELESAVAEREALAAAVAKVVEKLRNK